LAGTCKENGSGSNAEKNDGRKTVNRKKKRKISLEMDGENGRYRAMDTGCWEAKAHPGL
jgi:hypothetical protein